MTVWEESPDDEPDTEPDDDRDEYPASFVGPCTCEHEPGFHGWGSCDVDGCPCEAGWNGMTDRYPRDEAEREALLAKHGYPPDALPRGVTGEPGFSFVNRQGIKLRNWVCVLEGVVMDGHEGSDLDPGGGCIMCQREWDDIYGDQEHQ